MIDIKDYLNNFQYCESLTQYKRRKSREVYIGNTPLGGDNPIRIQSMTIANTRDTEATINEVMQLADAGCDYVRITAPSKREAENLENIKNGVRAKGYQIPLVADIHYTPNAAEIAAEIVEKVRINPGNYADKKKFEVFEISDEQYKAELERIKERLVPLVKKCKEHGTAMRIGTNHGSLSDRIMNRYGDTPEGMVESAMEFLRICGEHNFHDIVLSMKASNPKVMVQAYRMLVAKMNEENMHYPLHLGVTEAGDGETARIKSAAGIGTLLEDGLGDTIRVSLTEDSVYEVPVGQKLANRYHERTQRDSRIYQLSNAQLQLKHGNTDFQPFRFEPTATLPVRNIGGGNPPIVINDLSQKSNLRPLSLNAVGYQYEPGTQQWKSNTHHCDFIYFGKQVPDFDLPSDVGVILDWDKWLENQPNTYPFLSKEAYQSQQQLSKTLNFLKLNTQEMDQALIKALKNDHTTALLIEPLSDHTYPELRKLCIDLQKEGINLPVIPYLNYQQSPQEDFALRSATDLGGLLIDGLGDGVWLAHQPDHDKELISNIRDVNRTSFEILQATGARISTTEFIACPSCGRTQFDLQETTAKVRARTNHLKGVKIAVMGCIVNGPGEMADADYGYVGTGRGKVALYRGKEIVKKNIQSDHALDELINLIKEDGNWVEQSRE